MMTTQNEQYPADIRHALKTAFQPAAEIPEGTFYEQQHGGTERWTERTRDALLADLQADGPPAFRSVLGITAHDDDGKPTRLHGPFYADFDGDLEETCIKFREFLGKLQEHDVQLEQVRLYATGGRGFHVEIPPAVIGLPAEGLPDLHRTYKEMAMSLFVDTLDLRVFSSKRMWRTPNVKRENGRYKVPLTVEQALSVTPESYGALSAAPRLHEPLSPPTLAPGLAALFAAAAQKTVKAVATRKRTSKASSEFATKLQQGNFPTSERLLDGAVKFRANVGWNQIAMQVASLGLALGMHEDALIERARGLIDSHEGDSSRYGTPAKRERELRNQIRYQDGNPAYAPSIPAVLALLDEDATDLRAEVSPVTRAVTEFNKEHAVVLLGGKTAVMRQGDSEFGGTKVDFLGIDSLKQYYANRYIEVAGTDKQGNPTTERKPLVNVWLSHPARRTHEGVTFAPDGRCPSSFYNLWRGFAIEPAQEADPESKCAMFLDHLRRNVCQGDEGHYRYLLAWMADLVQRPGIKPGVVVVVRGEKGTGKSKVGEMLSALLGAHAMTTAHSRHVVGNFNKHLGDKLLVVAEEAFFAGDRAADNALKNLVTDKSVMLEPKGIDAVSVRSCHRIMMLTNRAWVVPASADERRYFVLDCGSENKQDRTFFAALDDQMHNRGGLAAFLQVLLSIDLSSIDVGAAPETAALREQKELSLDGPGEFLHFCLADERIAGYPWTDEGMAVRKGTLYEAYVEFSKPMYGSPESYKAFVQCIKKLLQCEDLKGSTRGDRAPRFALPPIEIARQRFEKATGIS